MDRTPALITLTMTIGVLGWLFAGLCAQTALRGAPRQTNPETRRALLLAAAVACLVFLITLPTHPPFATGQGLGRGYLLGAAATLAALWPAFAAGQGLRPARPETRATLALLGVAGVCFPAAAVASLTVMVLHSVLLDALVGAAVGSFVTALIVFLGALRETYRRAADSAEIRAAGTLVGAGMVYSTLIFSLVALAEIRGMRPHPLPGQLQNWSSLALAASAGVPLLLCIAALPGGRGLFGLPLPFSRLAAGALGRMLDAEETREAAARGTRLVVTAALTLGIGRLLAVRAVAEPRIFLAVATGLALGLLVWWLLAARTPLPPATLPEETAWRLRDIAGALVVITGLMAAHQLFAALGIGIALLAAWVPIGMGMAFALAAGEPAWAAGSGPERAGSLLRFALLGTVVLLYRLVQIRFTPDLRGASLTDHYALFALLCAVFVPDLLARALLHAAGAGPLRFLLLLLLAGGALLAAPALLLILWGGKVALALAQGLIVRCGLSALDAQTDRTMHRLAGTLLAAFLALGMALALAQWTHHALHFTLLARTEKIRLIIELAAGLIVLAAAGDAAGRLQRTAPRTETRTETRTEGGVR